MPFPVYWITGIPGTDVRDASKRIAAQLEPAGEVISIEQVMLDIYASEPERTRVEAEDLQRPGAFKQVVDQAPPRVSALWRKAAQNVTTRLAESSKTSPVILTFHAVYYADKFADFYSPIDLALLSKFPGPTSFLNLIDDIGDVACRLRRTSQVFARRPKMGLESVEATIRDLLTILEWRLNEFTTSRLIASMFDCSAFQLAVKHPTQTAVRILSGKGVPTYISHPISESRRRWTKEKGWPPFVEQVQRFSRALAEAHSAQNDLGGSLPEVVPIAPTTIDELRIADRNTEDGRIYVPRVLGRWDLLTEDDSLVSPAMQDGDENWLDPRGYFEGRLDSDTLEPDTKQEIRLLTGLLRALRTRIDAQVNARDHTLVQQCDNLVVYRPYFAYRVSGGVAEEVRHRDRLPGERKVVFVHHSGDFGLRDIGRVAEATRVFVWVRSTEEVEPEEISSVLKQGLRDYPLAATTAEGIAEAVERILGAEGIELDKPRATGNSKGPLDRLSTAEIDEAISDLWGEVSNIVNSPDDWKPKADAWIVADDSPEALALAVAQELSPATREVPKEESGMARRDAEEGGKKV